LCPLLRVCFPAKRPFSDEHFQHLAFSSALKERLAQWKAEGYRLTAYPEGGGCRVEKYFKKVIIKRRKLLLWI